MAISSIIFLIILIAAHIYFVIKAKDLIAMSKAVKGTVWNGNRTDRIGERIVTVISNVLGQKAVLKRPVIGIMHTLIFWGFLVITIGTLEAFLYELFPKINDGKGFSFEPILGHDLFGALVFVQDTFHLLVLIGVLYAAYRRIFIKPAGLGKSGDAMIILTITGSLMLSLLGRHSFEMISEPKWFDPYLWVSFNVSKLWGILAISPEQAHTLTYLFRWIHHILVLGFLMYIPGSKHLHVLAAGPNTFFRTLSTNKSMRKINLEDSNATTFGAGKITELSWKDTLDFYACTECGRCQDACPAWNTEKPLSPKKLINDLKHTLMDNKLKVLSKDTKPEDMPSIINEHLTDDVIWSCTSCRACESECPVFIEQTDKIFEVRRNLVLMESRFPPELQTVFKNVETNFSPWAMSPEDRDKWVEELPVKKMSEIAASGETIDYLFWVGCAGSFDDRNKKISRALVNIMNKAGIKFAILGNEEKCTGDPVRRMGNEYLAQTLINENVTLMNNYNVKKVVTACPHCFNAIKNDWKDFGGNYEVIHHTQLIADLIRSAKIKPTKATNEKITYHDSCYLGRWNDEYASPREILKSIPGIELKEMDANSKNGLCCGAGGGRMWMEEHIGTRINNKRTDQALSTNPTTIAANCPFCITMLYDGVKAKEKVETVKVLDIAEMVEASL